MRLSNKAAAIILAFIFLLSACGGGSVTNTTNTTARPETTISAAETTTAPVAATGEAPATAAVTPLNIELPPSNVELIETPSLFDSQAEALRQKIMDMPDTIKATGQTYYVSNKGNDGNSGTSPEEAWASLEKVSNYSFDEGDAVLFERGGLWRGSLNAKSGVSYGAYGSGPKPVIYGSLVNAAELEWEPTNLPNVYVCKEWFTKDVGIIVFNHGYAVGVKKLLGHDELKQNYDFYHYPEDKRVYLYLDKGNPAEVFSDIEIGFKQNIISIFGQSNVTVQNLCLKYSGAHAIGTTNIANVHVSGCEIGWIGGSILYDNVRYGNGIECWEACNGFIVENCYLYQIYDAGLTYQFKGTSDVVVNMENVRFENNLLDYCTYSIEYFLTQDNNSSAVMKNIIFKGNIMRNAGYGWGNQRPDKTAAAHLKSWGHVNRSDGFVIEDNILDRCRFSLFDIGCKDPSSLPQLKNNIFAQTTGRQLGYWRGNRYRFDDEVIKTIESLGIEKDPKVYYYD